MSPEEPAVHEEAERSFGGRVKNEPPGTRGPEVGDDGDAGTGTPSRVTGDPGGDESEAVVGMVSIDSRTGVGGLMASFGGTNKDPEMALDCDVGGGGIGASDDTTGDPGSELTSFSSSSMDTLDVEKSVLFENRIEDERESVWRLPRGAKNGSLVKPVVFATEGRRGFPL